MHMLFGLKDFRKDTKEVTNGIEIHPMIPKPEDGGTSDKCTIPLLKDIDPPKLDTSIDQYGSVELHAMKRE